MKALGCGKPMTALWSTVGLTHIGLPTAQPIRLFFLSFFLFLSLFSIASPFHSLCTPFSFSLIIYYFYHWISGLCKLRHIFFPPEEGRIKRGGGERAVIVMQSPESPPKFLNWLKRPSRGGQWGPPGSGGAHGVPGKDERAGRMATVILCSQSAL